MRRASSLIVFTILISQALSAPQFITFKDGKLGVNFGGYHAGVGLGGLVGGGGGGGGLFAEAGTPFGPAARAGLGGAVDGNSGGAAGGLYAGATAGGNVKAAAGLGGKVGGENAAGAGYASASSGNHYAASGLGGESSVAGSGGFTFSGTKTIGVPGTIVKETEVSVLPVETVEQHKEVELESNNEIIPAVNAGFEIKAEAGADKNVESNPETTFVVKEVAVEPTPVVVEKHIVHSHYKPSHEFHKTGYIGGFIGAAAGFEQPSVVKSVQPVVQKRVDVGVESEVHAAGAGEVDVHNGGGGQVTYTKQVTVARNPTLFQDIFNIPISTLKAVSNLLGGIAGGTSVSVQKSASVQAESDISSKHAPSSSSAYKSSDAHISVETPSASQIIDGIFAIPINTLGAVNTFLENNVSGRKHIQVTQDGSGEPGKVRLGPHARRRANKQRVILVEKEDHNE